jgi:hypothetical protein
VLLKLATEYLRHEARSILKNILEDELRASFVGLSEMAGYV